VRRFKKGGKSTATSASYIKKPEYQREPSLLEKLISPFFRKDRSGDSGPAQPDPKQAEVHFTLGLSMADNDNFLEQAKGEFRLAVKFDPDHKEGNYNLGLMCYKRGEFDEALIYFHKVVALDKDDQLARKMITLLRDD
jgi:tetratricopeptide (TPR) repeat protein